MNRKLTVRQRQVLVMFCSGMSYAVVARELGLSKETINPSLRQSARRLGAPGIARATLLKYASEAGQYP
jgi:DNA-binding NarL/FixJ family response regulator